jgi:hypothetical protein
VVVHPTSSNVAYMAALGNIYGSSPDRGVYRSTDGGRSWKKVLARAGDPENVGPVELAIDSKKSACSPRALGHAAAAVVRLCALLPARERLVQVHRWR